MGKYNFYEPRPSDPPEIGGVLTAEGLAMKGREYAYRREDGKIHITAKGHALLGEQQRTRAREFVDEGKWHGVTGVHDRQPPQPGL